MQSQLGVCVCERDHNCLLIDLFHHYRFSLQKSWMSCPVFYHSLCLCLCHFSPLFFMIFLTLYSVCFSLIFQAKPRCPHPPHTHTCTHTPLSADCLYLCFTLHYSLLVWGHYLDALTTDLHTFHILHVSAEGGKNPACSICWEESDLASVSVGVKKPPVSVLIISPVKGFLFALVLLDLMLKTQSYGFFFPVISQPSRISELHRRPASEQHQTDACCN